MIRVPTESEYPQFRGLNSKFYNDTEDRVQWRVKQVNITEENVQSVPCVKFIMVHLTCVSVLYCFLIFLGIRFLSTYGILQGPWRPLYAGMGGMRGGFCVYVSCYLCRILCISLDISFKLCS